MRRTLGTLSLAAAIGLTVTPAAPASAYCDAVIYAVTGKCANACTIAASAYHTADRKAHDLLPDVEFLCLA